MPTQMFVNLPVKDLDRSVAFFTQLGYRFNPQFTDENATCMIVGEDSFVMLLVEPFFQGFTPKPVADARAGTEAIIAISMASRAQVDALPTRRSPSAPARRATRRTTASCTSAATRTSTATCGRSSTSTRPRRERRNKAAGSADWTSITLAGPPLRLRTRRSAGACLAVVVPPRGRCIGRRALLRGGQGDQRRFAGCAARK